jgi:hypothetical protein
VQQLRDICVIGHGDPQLVGLAGVARVGDPGHGDVTRHALAFQLLASLRLQRDPGVGEVVGRRHHRQGGLITGRREKQAQRAEHARCGWHHHGTAAELAGQCGRVQRTGTAVGDERQPRRIDAALGADLAQRATHRRPHHRQNPGRPTGPLRQHRDGPLGSVDVEAQAPAEFAIRVEMTEYAVRVGHRRLGAPQPVAGRTGIGAGRAWTDSQRAASVNPGDRPAARAYGMDADRRGAKRQSGNLGGRRHFGLAVPDQAHVGGCAAHVEGERVAETGAARHGTRCDDARGGSRQQCVHRGRCDEIDTGGAATGGHHGDRRVGEPGRQVGQVTAHHRLDRGVEHARRGTLELAELRQQRAG